MKYIGYTDLQCYVLFFYIHDKQLKSCRDGQFS